MQIVLSETCIFGKIENKRTDYKNRNYKNELYNRGNAYFPARCTIGNDKNIENKRQYGDCKIEEIHLVFGLGEKYKSTQINTISLAFATS